MKPADVEKTDLESTQGDRFTLRRKHVGRGAILTLGLLITSLLVGGSGAFGASSDGVLFGATAQPRSGETQISAVQNLERDLGTKLPIVRGFYRWNSNLDNQFNNWVVDGDRRLMLSVKPLRSNGQEVNWRSIANAQPGSQIHNEMVALAQGAKQLDGEVWMAFHHEPEAGSNTGFGSSDDFIAAWRKYRTVFEQQGADVEWVWTMTSFSYAVNSSDRRSADKWYPGDAYVDYLGADPYNWAKCRNSGERDVSLEQIIAPFIEFGEKHPTKKLVLPEFAAHETGNKGAWIDEVRSYMKQPQIADKFEAIIYFNAVDPVAPRCNWLLDSSSSAMNAAGRLARDPFFNGSGSSSPSPAPTPTTAAPAPAPAPAPTTAAPAPAPAPIPPRQITLTGGCSVEVREGSDVVTWTPQDGDFTYNVRRNGAWIGNTKQSFYTNKGVTSGTYEVVARNRNDVGTFSCGSGTPTAPPATPTPAPDLAPGDNTVLKGSCTVRSENGVDKLTWTEQGSRYGYNIRRNGTWLGNAKRKESFTNTKADNGEYVIVARWADKIGRMTCTRS